MFMYSLQRYSISTAASELPEEYNPIKVQSWIFIITTIVEDQNFDEKLGSQ